ncbi:hypothetical protein GCM10017608_11880 [Agromyces luteolus]|uniref:Uncharacterized protein n=1 Tax=Agromyces luteolus TaxID=88373 RepID=A0A7C9LEJ7_9MICO|nr:hypothetical protein [Agromyces luteolus]MUN08712.1 hypothetical protein [Agromyces luteolus]GLK27255.1 hypothetical protein GCM10017608_11880 [Agromyces luteolus]
MTGPEPARSPEVDAPPTGEDASYRSDAVDELVARIVADEVAELRRGFASGAEFAVTRSSPSSEQMLHRLECASIESHLDRPSKWTAPHRRRLASNPAYRMPLPTLITRRAARDLAGVRSCRVCWPNPTGGEPRPLRRLSARSLGPQHVGHVLARPDGESIGTIVRWSARTGADLFGVEHDEIEIVTSTGVETVGPDDHVTIWDLPTDEQAIRRKAQLVQRLAGDGGATAG